MAGRTIGVAIPKVDGVAKVTGAARYVDDLEIEGALVGRTVRSKVPHGVLEAIERDESFDWSDVVFVTAEDIPGANVVALIVDDQPALVPIGGTVRHVDEPIALVAAPTARKAAEALAHVTVTIAPLPAIHSIEDSLAAGVVLHGDDNVFKRYEIRRGDDDIEAALAACDHVIESEYVTGAQEQMYIEPQGMVASWDGDGACRVIGSMQCPYYVHKALTALLGVDGEHAIVTQAVTGGGFGGKEEYPSMLAAHAALLARKAEAPVKMIYDRTEDVAATTKRHPARVRHRLGVRSDGSIGAADIDVVIDGGAYVTLSPVVLSRAVLHAAGPYKIDSVRVVGRAVATNTPPHGAFRGFGAPQVTFAYERQIQKAARLLGIGAFDMRRRNALRRGDETSTSQILDFSVGSLAVLEGVERALAAELGQTLEIVDDDRVRRGRGLAFYFHGAGFTGSGEQRLAGRAEVAATAGGFEVRASSTDIGQGALTIFSQIAADALGVEVSAVRVADPSTDRVPDSGPTVASRTCMVVGAVVGSAARKLKERLVAFAGERELDTGDLVEVARACVADQGEVSETVTYVPPPGIQWDDDTYTGSAYPVYGWAACVVDVAVDLDTYEATIERCVHAVDVGKAINPIIVKGQIEGGTLQALGWALLESVVYRDGRVVNANMTDCIIPTSFDAPEMETVIVEEPYPFGPNGAKGVGEIPMDGPAAAVAGALEDALGVAFDELPILPEVIQRKLADHG